jgi:hypothetical protein
MRHRHITQSLPRAQQELRSKSKCVLNMYAKSNKIVILFRWEENISLDIIAFF